MPAGRMTTSSQVIPRNWQNAARAPARRCSQPGAGALGEAGSGALPCGSAAQGLGAAVRRSPHPLLKVTRRSPPRPPPSLSPSPSTASLPPRLRPPSAALRRGRGPAGGERCRRAAAGAVPRWGYAAAPPAPPPARGPGRQRPAAGGIMRLRAGAGGDASGEPPPPPCPPRPRRPRPAKEAAARRFRRRKRRGSERR